MSVNNRKLLPQTALLKRYSFSGSLPKNRTVVEYSLKKSNYPIGVSSYSTSKELPEEFIAQLPTLEAIKKSFGK